MLEDDVRDTYSSTKAATLYFGIILVGANLRAPITSLGPVLSDIQHDTGLDETAAGLLNALPLMIFALLSLVAPALGRQVGLERVLGASIASIIVGTILRSLPFPGAIWAGTAVLSAGIAFSNVLLPSLVKRDFPSRAAGLIALYAAAMAGMAGIAAGAAVPIARMPRSDWRLAIGIWAVLGLVTLLIWLPNLRSVRHPSGTGHARGNSSPSPWRHPLGWQVSLYFACHSLIFYALVDWFSSFAADNGISRASSGGMLLVYQVVAVIANLGCAPLIRRFRNQIAIGFLSGILLFIGTTGLLLAPDSSLLWLSIAGLGAGVAMVTSLSLFGLRTRDHHGAAALSSMAQFVGYTGAATGPLLMGVLREATGGWTVPLTMLVLASLLTTVLASFAGRERTIEKSHTTKA